MRASILTCTAAENVRQSPLIVTVDGTMLRAPSVWISVIDTTAASAAATERDTIVWSPPMT